MTVVSLFKYSSKAWFSKGSFILAWWQGGEMRSCLRKRLMKCVVFLIRFIHCLVLLLALVGSSLDFFGWKTVTRIQENFTQFYIVDDAIQLFHLWRMALLWRVFRLFDTPFFTHFNNHFKERRMNRSGVENLSFRTLSFVDGGFW